MMDASRWDALMQRLLFPACVETLEALRSAYCEKHRHYHTLAHIDHCLTTFDRHRDLARRPEEVEIALWFHDAIYNPLASDNEAKSADWAVRFLAGNQFDEDGTRRVHSLILATVHDAPAQDQDTRLLVDIDLSILGADPDTYGQFEQDVRREYKWIPRPMFKKARRRILRSFLDRPSIFATDAFRQTLEAAARRNVRAAIDALA